MNRGRGGGDDRQVVWVGEAWHHAVGESGKSSFGEACHIGQDTVGETSIVISRIAPVNTDHDHGPFWVSKIDSVDVYHDALSRLIADDRTKQAGKVASAATPSANMATKTPWASDKTPTTAGVAAPDPTPNV